jgi:hypothetical protein
MISPHVWGSDILVVEVPQYVNQDCQCDLASVYKNLGSKTQSSAIDFTTGGFYQYCSRPIGGSPSNPLEQPRPGVGFEGRRHHQGKMNLAENGGGILNIQTIHGSNTVVESAEPAQAATTTFISDASVVRAAESHSKGPTLGLAKKSQVSNVEDIKKFLAKPVPILTSTFQNSDTVSTFTKVEALTTITANPLIADKLRGFAGIRATIVFRIVVNGNRFQQGRYMMCWIPMGGARTNDTRSNSWYNAHIATLRQRTQLHRVEIDINCDTEAELVVPFSSAINWFPLTKTTISPGLGEVGFLTIFPYVSLVTSGGSTTAPFKVYAHLEDVELFGAAVPQMGRRASARIVKKTASELEAKNAGVGPVESVMATMTNVSNALSVVPVLAPFAQPASWVFEALTGVAASFGWSKPLHASPAQRVVRNHAPYMGSINNDDYSLPLTLDVKNQVEAIPDLGFTGVDELDFLSFTSIPCYITQTPWATSSVNGVELLTLNVSPTATSTSVGSVIHHTPLSFVSSYFNYWRGGIIYKIKLVKTEFHSGRLCVTYSPINSVGGAVATTYADTPYLERRIYDIRECNEIIIEVPYMSVLPYLNVSSSTNKAWRSGTLSVWVEDPLVAPANVSSSITLLVEAYGASDIEFAFPTPISQTPVYGVVPQMGERSTRNDCRLDKTELSMVHARDQAEASSKCVGERVRSFRSLLKAYSSLPSTVGNPEVSATTLYIGNFFAPGYFYDSVTPVLPNHMADLFATLHGVFTYSRGGVRYALQIRDETTEPTVEANDASMLAVRMLLPTGVSETFANGTTSTALDSFATSGLKVIADTTDGNVLQLNIGAYTQSFTRLCSEHIVFKTGAGLNLNTNSSLTLAINDFTLVGNTNNPDAVNNRRWVKFRAAADDADFCQFVSIMPMIVLAST